jgi:hypothetical protein
MMHEHEGKEQQEDQLREDLKGEEDKNEEAEGADEVDEIEIIKGSELSTNWKHKVDSFEDMEMNPNLLRGVFGYGYEQPSNI